MKKNILPLLFGLIAQTGFSQYLIVGKDSLSVKDYIKDNQYGLEQSGVDKSVNSTVEFMLLQQLAKEKRVDTLSYFTNSVNQKIGELRDEKLYPKNIIDPMIQDFISSSKTEIQIQLFIKQKDTNDKTDYKTLYNDVKSGKMTMDDFLAKYAAPESAKAFYIKPGMLNYELYQQIKNTPINSYTPFIDKPNAVAFAKVTGTRPSLGYMVFGVLTIPNNADYEATKTKIYEELKSGKKFQSVVKDFGATEQEKNSGGAVMGSPILPDEVYNALKGQQKDFYTKEPILFGDKYFIFNIYNLLPYELKDDNTIFFQKEMMAGNYREEVIKRLVDSLKTQNEFSETKDFAEIKRSYQNYQNFKNPNAVLFSYGKYIATYQDFKKAIDAQYKDLDKTTPDQWSELADSQLNQYILGIYSENFKNLPDVKSVIDEFKRNLYSEYIFSEYLKNEIEKNPQYFSEYYNNNKSKFVWEKRAESRVAVISDPALVKEIQKEIANKDEKNWNALKEKYKDKVNDKNQVLVHFEEGKIQESADIFKKYNIPFKKGIFLTKISERDVVIAIDELLPEQQMTLEEAKPEMEDAVTEIALKKVIAEQKVKTKVEIQPAFLDKLYEKFKK